MIEFRVSSISVCTTDTKNTYDSLPFEFSDKLVTHFIAECGLIGDAT